MLLLPTYILEGNVATFYSLFSLLVAILSNPALSNSIAFHHISEQKLFPIYPSIRQYRFYCNWPRMGYYKIFDNVIVFKVAAIFSNYLRTILPSITKHTTNS